MEIEKIYGLIESILFFESEPVSLQRLEKLTGYQPDEIKKAISDLGEMYQDDRHGLMISDLGGGYSFQIKKEFNNEIKTIYNIKDKQKLSKSILTVLSIIAYKQPITKMEIDEIRGVSSDNSMRILLEKGLIEITGRKEALGRPLLYGTTVQFLKYFNLKDIKDLPQINELKTEEFDPEEEE